MYYFCAHKYTDCSKSFFCRPVLFLDTFTEIIQPINQLKDPKKKPIVLPSKNTWWVRSTITNMEETKSFSKTFPENHSIQELIPDYPKTLKNTMEPALFTKWKTQPLSVWSGAWTLELTFRKSSNSTSIPNSNATPPLKHGPRFPFHALFHML